MCYSAEATPPVPVIEGGSLGHQDLELVAADGTRFAAFTATALDPKGPALVILPDVRGLHGFYIELTKRFAEHGYDAVAIDYFGRTAGVGRRDDEFAYMDHVPLCTLEGVTADTRAAVEYLRGDYSERQVFVLGFCFGGSNAWLMAAQGLGLAGVIGFYGNPKRQPVAPLDNVGSFACPVLALMGGDDPGIPVEVVEEFRDALDRAGVDNEVIVYDGTPHSFFDRQQEAYAEDSADAWRRSLDFIERLSS